MSEPADVGDEVWKRWILEAIYKIRSQKQRPSVERICHAIRQHHNYHEDVVSERLERAVRVGAVLKVYNKGQSSYKDPGGLQSKTLRISPDADISRAVAKAVRELGERDGSSLRSIERYLRQAYAVTVEREADVRAVVRAAARRAVARGLLVHCSAGYKPTPRPLTQPDRHRHRHRHRDTAEKVCCHYLSVFYFDQTIIGLSTLNCHVIVILIILTQVPSYVLCECRIAY